MHLWEIRGAEARSQLGSFLAQSLWEDILSYRVIFPKLVQIRPTIIKTVISVEQTDMNGCPYWLLDEFTGVQGLPGPLPTKSSRALHRECEEELGCGQDDKRMERCAITGKPGAGASQQV